MREGMNHRIDSGARRTDTPGEKQKLAREFYERLVQGDPNLRLEMLATMGAFRKEIIDLASKDQSGILAGIDPQDLNSTDMVFYRRFQRGVINEKSLEDQLSVLASLEEAKSSRKLLNYMLYLLRENKKKRKGPGKKPWLI